MTRKIEIEVGTFSDVKIKIWDNDAQARVVELTWDELDTISAGVAKLRQPAWNSGLTDRDRAEMARDDEEYHSECQHFHTGHENGCPQVPCGDYRCCIN